MAKLISNWREGWKFYSAWALAVLALVPDIYNAILASGVLDSETIPSEAAWIIRGVAILGIVSRFINQAKPEGLPPEIDPRP